MSNRFLHYGGAKYILTPEAEARLHRVVDTVYGNPAGHEWFTLYPGSGSPCSLLLAKGVPMSVETEFDLDEELKQGL